MATSPTTRRTRSRLNTAAISGRTINDEKPRTAINPKLKKSAVQPAQGEEKTQKPSIKMCNVDELHENEEIKIEMDDSNVAEVYSSEGGNNSEPTDDESRNDAPAKAGMAKNASSDTAMNNHTGKIVPLNSQGGEAMEIDSSTGEAPAGRRGAQQPSGGGSGEKLLSQASVHENKISHPDNIAELQIKYRGAGSAENSTSQMGHRRGGINDSRHTSTMKENKTDTTTAEILPSHAISSTTTTSSKLISTNADAKASTSNNNSSISENQSSSPNSFSMTLAIGPSDTQRLFMASKAFNEEIQKIRFTNQNGNKSDGFDGSVPPTATTVDNLGPSEKKRKAGSGSDGATVPAAAVVQSSPSSTSMVVSSNGTAATTMTPTSKTILSTNDQIALLVAAAKSTKNPLLSSFMSKLKNVSTEEKETCLLFFLDADKSTKLLMAFDVLNDKKNVGGDNENKGGKAVVSSVTSTDRGVNDTMAAMAIDAVEADKSKVLSRRGLILLFQSFLTSISACVHNKNDGEFFLSSQGENKPPNSAGSSAGDWTGSEKTAKEISEVAVFAANHLVDYAMKEEQIGGKESSIDPDVSFDQFGKWYNSGGFSLVPWLELLDLSKWDYTLKTNKNVTIEQVPLGEGSTAATTVSSSIKRAKFDASSSPVEAIGSPTGLFETGAAIGATPQPLPPKQNGGVQSFSAMFGEPTQSRNVVSFDFSGTTAGAFHIDITEENLVMLRQLVTRTGFASLTPQHVESVILKHSRCERRKYGDAVFIISRQQFGKFIRDIVPKEASKNFDPNEIENFSNYFTNFFTCFDYNWSDLKKDEVNAKELMVGFSFLCAGNKSTKLAAAYEMLDVEKNGYLTQRGLMQYLRAYLTMLAGISLLSSDNNTTTQIRKQLMSTKRNNAFLAVENGAKWTLGHFLRAFEAEHNRSGSTRNNAVVFEDFAKWYTEGGYAVAPWLELLDLQKFLSLIGDLQQPKQSKSVPSSQGSLADVLFTFPLAKERSLVVLRDDAHYVRAVVSEMGLLSLTCEDIWTTLSKDVAKKLGTKKSAAIPVDQASFVECMMKILSKSKKPTKKSSWANFSPEETLKNFFLSFDLMQVNQVPLNQLMCGLTLLCGGKKSSKLGYAFGLFCGDGKSGKKKVQTMGHGDFIQFFRSFLIVMFSCCNQSLSLSADTVSQYISDTAQAVADAVISYWKGKKVEKVKFDHFSKWYNEGGFQMAPWLELLDLHKWVLADDEVAPATAQSAPVPAMSKTSKSVISVPVVHAPVTAPAMDKEIFNALVGSPNPKDRISNLAPSPNDNVPPPPDDSLLLNLVDEDVDMVSLRILPSNCIFSFESLSHSFLCFLIATSGFYLAARTWWEY